MTFTKYEDLEFGEWYMGLVRGREGKSYTHIVLFEYHGKEHFGGRDITVHKSLHRHADHADTGLDEAYHSMWRGDTEFETTDAYKLTKEELLLLTVVDAI